MRESWASALAEALLNESDHAHYEVKESRLLVMVKESKKVDRWPAVAVTCETS